MKGWDLASRRRNTPLVGKTTWVTGVEGRKRLLRRWIRPDQSIGHNKELKKTDDISRNSKIRVSLLESLELTCKYGAWFLWQNRHVQEGLSLSRSVSRTRIAGPMGAVLWPRICEWALRNLSRRWEGEEKHHLLSVCAKPSVARCSS